MITTSGVMRLRLRDRFAAVASRGDDLHVGLGIEDHPQAFTHGLVIIGEEDAQVWQS